MICLKIRDTIHRSLKVLDRKFFAENAVNIVARYRKFIFDPAGGGIFEGTC